MVLWPFLPLPSAEDWALVMAARTAPEGEKAFVLLSHLAFVFPVVAALTGQRMLFLLAAIAAVGGLLVSPGYHTCVTYDVCGGIDLVAWRSYDYITAPLMVVATVLLVIAARDLRGATARRMEPVVYVLIVLAIVFAQLRYPFSTYVLYVSGVACALLATLLWILVVRPRHDGDGDRDARPPPLNGWFLLLAVLFLAGGVVAFLWHTMAIWPHALSHMLFAFAMGFFILGMRPAPAPSSKDTDTDVDADADV